LRVVKTVGGLDNPCPRDYAAIEDKLPPFFVAAVVIRIGPFLPARWRSTPRRSPRFSR
jgi:hypothetical protein